MAEGDVTSMIGPQAGAAYGHTRTMAFAAGQIEDFADDYIFVGIMCPHPVGRMNALIIEAVQIHRVRAVNRKLAGIDEAADSVNQLKILVLIITPERSRKQNQGQAAAIAKSEH